MEIEVLKEKIVETLQKNLPKEVVFEVSTVKKYFGDDRYIIIKIMTSKNTINRVEGQHPDLISMCANFNGLYDLEFSHFGCFGGQLIYREIDPTIEKEKYNALGTEKISFRKPQKNEKAFFKALEGVCKKYVETLVDIKKRGLLRKPDMYGFRADYSFLDRY